MDPSKIAEILRGADLNTLFNDIRTTAVQRTPNTCSFIKVLFSGDEVSDKSLKRRRFETYKFTMNLLQTVDLLQETSTELVNILIKEVEAFRTSSLMQLADHLVLQIMEYNGPNVRWLEVLPKVLLVLATRDTIVYNGEDMSGLELKNFIIRKICDSNLRPKSITQLVPALKEVEMHNNELRMFVEMMLSALPLLQYQDMPSYVHQLLTFPSGTYRKMILQNIISYFVGRDQKMSDPDENSESDVIFDCPDRDIFCQVEGSVILVLQVSCKEISEMGKLFVKMLKTALHSPSMALSPFTFSIALSLTSVLGYENQVLDILKNLVLNSFGQKEKCHQCLWIRDILPEPADVEDYMRKAILNSKQGWDHVSQGLVKFSFILLDTFGPKTVCGRTPSVIKPHVQTVSEKCCALGGAILRKTFRTHRMVRSKIFSEILQRIVIKTTSPINHYIDTLSQLVHNDPLLLLEVLAKVMEVLDYLPFLSYTNALGVLKVLTPLLKFSMPLKDALMLVLRKALFHRDMEPRKIAISGYLTLLKKLDGMGSMSLSQSQCSTSSQASMFSQPGGTFSQNVRSKNMCLEIMGILKRVLMQQAETKKLLYENLHDVVCKNPSIADIILELLLSQLEKYLDISNKSILKLDIASCLFLKKEKDVVEEPLAHLLMAICHILQEIKDRSSNDNMDNEGEQSAEVILTEKLKTLVTNMSSLEFEELNLDKIQDVDDSMPASKKETLFLLIGVYEALMEFSLLNISDFEKDRCQELILLHQKYRKIVGMFQSKKTNKMTKNKTPVQLPASFLTMKFIAAIMENMFLDASLIHKDGLEILRADNFFINGIINTCNNKLALYNETGKSDGFSDNMENFNDFLHRIARVYLKTYSTASLPDFPSLEFEEIAFPLSHGLQMIFSYMSSNKLENFQKFAVYLSKHIPSATDSAGTKVLKKFQRLIVTILSDTSDEDNKRLNNVVPLLTIIGHLCMLPNIEINEVFDWLKQLCENQCFDEVGITKKMVTLCLELSQQHKDQMNFLFGVASDIHLHLGDTESDSSVSGSPHFKIIDDHTSTTLMPILINHLEKILEDVEWALNALRTDSNFVKNSFQPSTSHLTKKKEENVCKLLLEMIKIFHQIVQTAVPVGNTTNSILKVTTTLYKCLTNIVKYYISLYDQKLGHLLSTFEKMVKLSGTHLTTYVYNFMTYVQTVTNDNSKKTKANSTNKAAKDIKTMPGLVYGIEVYEQQLILLSKKSKSNLMLHMKLSTARDFRIDADVVAAVAQQEEAEDANDESIIGNDVNESVNVSHNGSTKRKKETTTTSSKKRKTSKK